MASVPLDIALAGDWGSLRPITATLDGVEVPLPSSGPDAPAFDNTTNTLSVFLPAVSAGEYWTQNGNGRDPRRGLPPHRRGRRAAVHHDHPGRCPLPSPHRAAICASGTPCTARSSRWAPTAPSRPTTCTTATSTATHRRPGRGRRRRRPCRVGRGRAWARRRHRGGRAGGLGGPAHPRDRRRGQRDAAAQRAGGHGKRHDGRPRRPDAARGPAHRALGDLPAVREQRDVRAFGRPCGGAAARGQHRDGHVIVVLDALRERRPHRDRRRQLRVAFGVSALLPQHRGIPATHQRRDRDVRRGRLRRARRVPLPRRQHRRARRP